MDIFFNWARIEEIAQLYQDKATSTLKEGTPFYPHVLGFLADVGEKQNAIYVVVPPCKLTSRLAVEIFVKYIANSLPTDHGRIEAAGFLAMLPRGVAEEFFDLVTDKKQVSMYEVPPSVVVLHVEHVYFGFRTWALENPLNPIGWRLVSQGIVSKFPSCLPLRSYGVGTIVGSA